MRKRSFGIVFSFFVCFVFSRGRPTEKTKQKGGGPTKKTKTKRGRPAKTKTLFFSRGLPDPDSIA
jgi:hypothetical protein